jgi:hypothetical protein
LKHVFNEAGARIAIPPEPRTISGAFFALLPMLQEGVRSLMASSGCLRRKLR